MSTVFRFSLQRVLELRRMREQARAAELVQARTRSEDALEACRQLAEAHGSVPGGLAAAAGVHQAGDLQGIAGLVDLIGEHLRHSFERAEGAEKDAAESLVRFEESLRDRRVLDRLRDRQLDQWQTEERRTDLQEMDELALSRHVRGNGGRS